MGAVAFNTMPADERVPLFYAEVNAGVAPYQGTSRSLFICRKLATGTAVVGKPIPLGSIDANQLGGPGSMLADVALYARYHNSQGAVWVLPVADPVNGVQATGSITITGTATASGTLVRYVAGERYEATVAQGDAAATIAANLAAAINNGYTKFNRRMLSSASAAAAAGVITLTARHTGLEGNMIRVESALDGDEFDPAGLTVVIASPTLTGGAGAIDFPAALASLGNEPFDWIFGPYNSTANLATARAFLSDSGSGRWSPTIGLNGHYLSANDASLVGQTVFGAALNDRHASVLATNTYPAPLWCWIAALGGLIGASKNLGAELTAAIEIARPMQTLELQGLRAPAAASAKWGQADRQALYSCGMSALTFGPDGTPRVDRVLTTYQVNAWGVADTTFLGIETVAIAAYVRNYMRQRVTSTYPRCVLRDDNPNGLQGVTTPDQIKATLVHAYTELDQIGGVVENTDLFAKYLLVERASDPNRVNCYLPTDVANQLIVVAANITIFPQITDAIAALQ